MRRAKTHFWREDHIAGFSLAYYFKVGSGKPMFRRRFQQANKKHLL